jgi:putative phosphoesterase
MKILVCSDSHGDELALEKIVLLNQNCDLYLHCGDIGLGENEISPFVCVRGNCDRFPYPLERNIQTEWGTIHIEHGNNYSHLTPEYIQSLNCFIFLFGHTHVREHGYDGKTYVFNPGSLTEPRDANEGSYLILDISKEGKVSFQYKEYVF